MTSVLMVLREALVSARSQPVAAALTALMVAAMCASLLLTAGRTEGSQRAILQQIDSEGTRSITVRADAAAHLNPVIVQRLSAASGVQWAGAFTAAQDVVNPSGGSAGRVALRTLYSAGHLAGAPNSTPVPRGVSVSPAVLRALAMDQPVGELISVGDGTPYQVASLYRPSHILDPIAPSAVRVGDISNPPAEDVVTLVIVVARSPNDVDSVLTLTRSVLAAQQTSGVEITSSAQLAKIRSTLDGSLGALGHGLIMAIAIVTSVIVAVVNCALVMFRRRDFGRRRALGATRLFVVSLIVTQIAILSAGGAVLGSGGAYLALAVLGAPPPSGSFGLATVVLSWLAGTIAAVIPAVAASRRDPLIELRQP
ncbi:MULTISPECIES: FtsX-like permease family protein [unclassified Curtobacterium]|uniref:ABC transporter permease n=1 Tax=unclassified Curtobacterium TaxID=257496 RepID=UPI000F48C016|nr:MULTISPECIES: FtsX-like permease family protein [unclassified Curtobacterium]